MELIEVCMQTKKNGLERVKAFINAGADLNCRDRDGWTALMWAAEYSNYNSTEGTVKLLIDAGADLNCRGSDGKTALMLAAIWSNSGSTEGTVKLLIDAGADLNCRDSDGRTALMKAAARSNRGSTEGTVKLLVDAGADTTGVVEIAHTDKIKVVYDCILLPRKVAFGIGWRDPSSTVSRLPREICKVILDFCS